MTVTAFSVEAIVVVEASRAAAGADKLTNLNYHSLFSCVRQLYFMFATACY
jgi:hypothetical protein